MTDESIFNPDAIYNSPSLGYTLAYRRFVIPINFCLIPSLLEEHKMIYLVSTFSPGMVANIDRTIVEFYKVGKSASLDTFINLAKNATNAIGHPATKALAESVLGFEITEVDPKNRVKVAAEPGDVFVIFQYIGPRLTEGQIMSKEEVDRNYENGCFELLIGVIC